MKNLLILSFAIILLGFSLVAAQTPDAPYLMSPLFSTPIHANSADLDNDGNPDLAVVTFGGDSIYTFLGDGFGTFGTRRAYGVAPYNPADVLMRSLDFADFNGDGNLDIVVASQGNVYVLVYFGNGDGTLTAPIADFGTAAMWVEAGHFNSGLPDLDPDFAVLLTTGVVRYWFGPAGFSGPVDVSSGGTGPFFMTKQTEPGSAPPLDHIAVANRDGSGTIGIIISDGSGGFRPTVVLPARPNVNGITWNYLNNDNLLDLAYCSFGIDSVFVRTGTSLTAYNPEVSYNVANGPFSLASGDFTGDGFIDLAAGAIFNDTVDFLVNNKAGSFLPTIPAQLTIVALSATAVDINNNGLPDLLIGAAGGDAISIFNLQSPSVSPASIPGNPATGAALPLPTITASDNTNIASVKLVYRQMGKTNYDTLTLTAGAGTPTLRDYTGTLPAPALTNRGLEYFYRTSDGFVTASVEPTTNLIPFRRLRTTVSENAPQTPNRSYRLVSLPMDFSPPADGAASVQLADDLGSAGPDSWRLFSWNAFQADTSQDTSVLKGYLEFGDAGFPNFSPGRSMFLGTAGSRVYDGVGLSTIPNAPLLLETSPGETTLVDYYLYFAPLDSGWNMIATPFPYSVHLDSVDVIVPDIDFNLHEVRDPVRDNRIGLGGANLRERTATGYIPPSPPYLKPWRGYFLKNNGPEQVYLLYPKLDGNFPATAPSVSKALAAGLDWKIDIAARSGETETPPTTLGTSKAAMREYDRLDWELPPPLPGDFRVVFQRGKEFGAAGDYLTDIRPTLTESETWSFTVQPGGTRAIELNFDGLVDVPAEYDVILSDVEGRARQNLRLEPLYRFIASIDRHFELTVAPKTAGPVALLPTKYELHQNLPNPFNPQTLIKYDLPEAANVRLEVFNILGQKVTSLVDRFEAAGPKSALWDGRDESGAKVSSGIYFYKLVAGDFVATKKMMLVK